MSFPRKREPLLSGGPRFRGDDMGIGRAVLGRNWRGDWGVGAVRPPPSIPPREGEGGGPVGGEKLGPKCACIRFARTGLPSGLTRGALSQGLLPVLGLASWPSGQARGK